MIAAQSKRRDHYIIVLIAMDWERWSQRQHREHNIIIMKYLPKQASIATSTYSTQLAYHRVPVRYQYSMDTCLRIMHKEGGHHKIQEPEKHPEKVPFLFQTYLGTFVSQNALEIQIKEQ